MSQGHSGLRVLLIDDQSHVRRFVRDQLATYGIMDVTAAASGRDSAPDLVTAHKWFNLAAMRGMPEARDLRAELAGQMTKDDVAEALKQARAWLATHAPSKVVLAA